MTLAPDGLPPLREIVAAHGLAPRKSLGQNFLFDLNLTGRIARAAGPLDGVVVIEVGPGPGGLTRALLSQGARKVIAIERDERCLAALAEIGAHWRGRLEIVAAGALDQNYAALAERAEGAPVRICANLPYNIATPLLALWLEGAWPPFYDRLILMFQREVAQRIVAGPAERADYGRLGVLAGWRTARRILFDISPAAFTPPPKVTSSVVELIPRARLDECDAGLLPPDGGDIEVFGIDALRRPIDAKRIVACLPDEPMLYDKLDPLEDLEFVTGLWGIEARRAQNLAHELLQTLGLWPHRNQRCERFSRGMKQKVALAGALVHEPKLLMLDEPLTGLDAATARQVKDLLAERVRQGATIILTTHILEVAERLADRIGIIQHGRLIAQGTLVELRTARNAEQASLEDLFLPLTSNGERAA